MMLDQGEYPYVVIDKLIYVKKDDQVLVGSSQPLLDGGVSRIDVDSLKPLKTRSKDQSELRIVLRLFSKEDLYDQLEVVQ